MAVLRGLAVVYFVAFLSFALQITGLIGSHGIMPAAEFLSAVHQIYGAGAYAEVPTLFWISSSDFFLQFVAWAGVVVSVIFWLGYFPRASAATLWILFLSLVRAGDLFLGYQWEALLLEAGFIAILSGSRPSRYSLFLFRWLLFRLMFESGLSKILSHDPTWRDFTALSYHYETQPLPNPISWYVHQLPGWFHSISCGVMLAVELVVPFLFFFGSRLRKSAGLTMIGFQLILILTGNFAYFNWLTIALSLSLFEEEMAVKIHQWEKVVAAFLVVLSILPYTKFRGLDFLDRFQIANSYGLFAVMTTERNEIQIEGSRDGKDWYAYELPWKPGPLNRRPGWVAPFQPRLDWQLWFAALSDFKTEQWLLPLSLRLLNGQKEVLSLFSKTPFGSEPPKFLRMELYRYRFTAPEEKKRTGNYWKKELLGPYSPVISRESFHSGSQAP